MKKKATVKKLVLHKESIRRLGQEQVKEAAGCGTISMCTNCAQTGCAFC
jgi:hypothetical protein